MRNVVTDEPPPVSEAGVHERDPEPDPRAPRGEREVSGAAHATQDRRGHGRFRTRLTRQDGHNDRGDQAQDGTNDGAEEQEG